MEQKENSLTLRPFLDTIYSAESSVSDVLETECPSFVADSLDKSDELEIEYTSFEDSNQHLIAENTYRSFCLFNYVIY